MPPVNLSVDQQGIDHFAAVVQGDIAQEFCLAGFFVDLDDADVRAERKCKILRLEKVGRGQAGFHIRRKFLGDVRRQSNFLNRQACLAFSVGIRESEQQTSCMT